MAVILLILAEVAVLLCALIGCFTPILPGGIIGYTLIWLPALLGQFPSTFNVILCSTLLAGVLVADYCLPPLMTRVFKGSPQAKRWSFIGGLLGLFYLPWGVLLGPLLGAFCAELWQRRGWKSACLSGVGAVIGLTISVSLKVGLILYCATVCWQAMARAIA